MENKKRAGKDVSKNNKNVSPLHLHPVQFQPKYGKLSNKVKYKDYNVIFTPRMLFIHTAIKASSPLRRLFTIF